MTELLLIPVLLFFGIPYIAGPILVYFVQKNPVKNNLKQIEEQRPLDPVTHWKILSNGFTYIGSAEMELGKVKAIFSLFKHSELKMSCMLAHMSTKGIQKMYVELGQRYDDDSTIYIFNSSIPEIYPKVENAMTVRAPFIQDFDDLLQAEIKLIKRFKPRANAVIPANGEEFKEFELSMNQVQENLIKTGYQKAKVVNGKRSLTIKGAILFTWKVCWPVNKIIDWRDIRATKKLLKDLDYN